MSTIINFSIEMTKAKQLSTFKSKNGKEYLNLTAIVEDELNDYGQDVSVQLPQSKEQREAKESKTYVGNGKVVYTDGKVSVKR